MKDLLIFVGGAVLGGIVSWVVAKRSYEKKLSKTRDIYAELSMKQPSDKESTEEPMNNMQGMACSLGYSYNLSDVGIMDTSFTDHPTERENNEPYLIVAARFESDPMYEKHYLSYSVKEDELYEGEDDALFVVYDDNGEPEDLTTTDILGTDFIEEALYVQGAEIIFVRNELLQMDFEVEVYR